LPSSLPRRAPNWRVRPGIRGRESVCSRRWG
jgi:hypothetical protein